MLKRDSDIKAQVKKIINASFPVGSLIYVHGNIFSHGTRTRFGDCDVIVLKRPTQEADLYYKLGIIVAHLGCGRHLSIIVRHGGNMLYIGGLFKIQNGKLITSRAFDTLKELQNEASTYA